MRVCSVELQKPAAGQPTLRQVLDTVLKECKKENLVYKMAALRSAANILEAAKEDRFQELADVLFPVIRKVKYLTAPPGSKTDQSRFFTVLYACLFLIVFLNLNKYTRIFFFSAAIRISPRAPAR